jgi:HD-like signal output (HDOD) protein
LSEPESLKVNTLLAGVAALLRGWLGGRSDRGGGSPPLEQAGGADAPQDARAENRGDDPPDARLHAALTDASSALWRHALGASTAVVPGPEVMPPLRSTVQSVLDGKLAERYFPRRPQLMPQLMAVVRDPTAAATRLAEIIAQDPVLTGNVLRLANSAWYRLTKDPVETLQRAVIVCGTDGLQSLATLSLMQPVFRGESGGFGRLPQLLWNRTTRATLAADLYARRVCPGERHGAQLLVLLRALGPLVVFRIIDEHYRAQPAAVRDAAASAALLVELGGCAAARIATQWDSSERICGVLAALHVSDRDQVLDEVQVQLADAVAAGELLGTISILISERAWDTAAGLKMAGEVGMPRDWMLATLTRLVRQI